MWLSLRTRPLPDPQDLAQQVERLLREHASCGVLTSAANRWADAATRTGATAERVTAQLEAWAGEHDGHSRAAAVRVGLRLHPAVRVRAH